MGKIRNLSFWVHYQETLFLRSFFWSLYSKIISSAQKTLKNSHKANQKRNLFDRIKILWQTTEGTWNTMARNDRWGWLNCGLGGILVLESLSLANEYSNHYLGQKKTTSSLKNNNIFVTCTHTFTWCQRRPWYFTCICKSLIWISHYQQ